jgi:outer membrane protein assembly factor BamB
MSEKGTAYILPLVVVAVTLGMVIFVLLYQIAPTSNNIFRTLPFSNAATPIVTWPAFDGGGAKNGVNASETALNASTINNLATAWQITMPDYVDSSMVTASNVTTPQGTKDLIFVNGVSGNLIAYDQATGALIWSHQAPGGITNNQGTKTTPVIDPSGNFVYHYGNDGKIHKVDITNGQEITTNGFPATVSSHVADEKGSGSMSIGNGYVYAILSGYAGDFGHYNGHVAAVNLTNGAVTVWNATCSNIHVLEPNVSGQTNYCSSIQSGIWGRAGAVIDPVDGSVYVATGNGPYNANTGGQDYGDSIIKLSPDLLTLKDSYTPSSFQNMQDTDQDLGSVSPAILPNIAGSNTPHLMVQGGKDHAIRLINRDNMSGQGGPAHVGGELQTITGINGDVVPHPVVWTDSGGQIWVFITTTTKTDLYAYKVVTSGGTTQLQQVYHNSNAGTSPLMANGLLYLQTNANLRVVDPPTGNVLYNSNTHGVTLGNAHWESPLVMNGRVFIVDESHNFTALSSSTAPTPSPTPSKTPSPSPTPTKTPSPTLAPTPTPTASPTPQPSSSACQGADLDSNGTVNIFDYNIIVSNFGKSGVGTAGGDIDNNGTVNIFDYNTLVGNFGKTGC